MSLSHLAISGCQFVRCDSAHAGTYWPSPPTRKARCAHALRPRFACLEGEKVVRPQGAHPLPPHRLGCAPRYEFIRRKPRRPMTRWHVVKVNRVARAASAAPPMSAYNLRPVSTWHNVLDRPTDRNPVDGCETSARPVASRTTEDTLTPRQRLTRPRVAPYCRATLPSATCAPADR
jgi:hypothetical protein